MLSQPVAILLQDGGKALCGCNNTYSPLSCLCFSRGVVTGSHMSPPFHLFQKKKKIHFCAGRLLSLSFYFRKRIFCSDYCNEHGAANATPPLLCSRARIAAALSVIIDTSRQYLSWTRQQLKHNNGISYGLCVFGSCKWIFGCDKRKDSLMRI